MNFTTVFYDKVNDQLATITFTSNGYEIYCLELSHILSVGTWRLIGIL